MKKLFTLLVLLVAIVTGAQADSEWVLENWSTDHTGLTYWASGSSANIPSTSKDKTVPAWTDGSTYDTYSGTGGSSNFQLDSKTGTWKSSHPNRVFSFDVSANDEIKVYFCGGGTGNRSIYVSYNASTTNRDTQTAFGGATADGYTPTILTATATTAGTVYVWCDNNVRIYAIKVKSGATEAFTVTFDAGTNGTCATSSLTETAPGAGVTLPEVTANEGYGFTGWYTDATDATTKVGDAGDTYKPTAAITLQAGYSALAAPTIEIDNYTVSTYKGVAKTFTATATGVPDPTVKWYQSETAATTGGTEVGTGATYSPDVTKGGTFYYYAVASNSEGTATSQLITLTVTDPDKYITGNAYYMSVDEVAVAGENVYADDITMTIKDYEGGAANADNSVSGINSNYVAQITGTHNGWGTEFVATKNGTLSVGVIINGGKTFTLTNVTSFDYNGVQDEGNNNTSESAGTNASSTWKPSKKQWTVLTFDVVAGTTYKLSVAGSKMGFYGFEFVPALTLVDTDGSTNATNIAALNGKVASVKVERTLSPDYYNTLFLPFAMSAEQIQAAFGEGVQVATFTGMNSETQFGFGNVTAMEANVPYLVKPAQEVNGFTVEGVTISNTAAAGVVSGGYSMVGTYDTFTNGSSTSGGSIGGGSIGISIGGSSSSSANEIYYFTTSNTIKKLSSTGSIKGLRAFMVKLPAGKTSVETIVSNAGITFGGGAGGDVIIRARQNFVLNLDDDNTTTGIEAIDNGQLTIDNDAPAYNLAGQKVGKGYKGIVIINGKKVVK